MVETILTTIGKSIEVLLKNKEEKKGSISGESGVFLFFSFDLSDSTAFKTEHPSLWANVFSNFYEQILRELGVDNYKSPSPEQEEESTCVRKLWKLIGDEVLLYVEITKAEQLYRQITNVNSVIKDIMDKIATEVEREVQGNECGKSCVTHCQNIKDVIISSLGIKTTAWIAECYKDSEITVPNIIYQPLMTTPNSTHIDFLGRDIDEGFRMAKYAVKNKIILSPLLAWLIWKAAQEEEDKKKIVKANFKITAFLKMKGVWRSRKVPIVMFHQQFEKFEEILEYDELDLETYANIREKGYKNFTTESLYDIERMDDILGNVYRKKEAEALYEKIMKMEDIKLPLKGIEKMQELHIACIIFDKDNKVLLHQDGERGLEFGCVKKIFTAGRKTWKSICEEGYKEKYKLDILVGEQPIPVATYYYEKSNALGLIVAAQYNGTEEELKQKQDWKIYTPEEIEAISEKTVDSLKENVKRAIGSRNL